LFRLATHSLYSGAEDKNTIYVLNMSFSKCIPFRGMLCFERIFVKKNHEIVCMGPDQC
jgi:hypothetical protein